MGQTKKDFTVQCSPYLTTPLIISLHCLQLDKGAREPLLPASQVPVNPVIEYYTNTHGVPSRTGAAFTGLSFSSRTLTNPQHPSQVCMLSHDHILFVPLICKALCGLLFCSVFCEILFVSIMFCCLFIYFLCFLSLSFFQFSIFSSALFNVLDFIIEFVTVLCLCS